VCLLYEANYSVPPDFRGPPSWRLIIGSFYIPLTSVGHAMLEEEIQVTLSVLTDEEQALPERYPENYTAWEAYFRERYEWELASYEGPPPPARKNSEGMCCLWSAPGHNLAAVLEMPPRTPSSFSRRHGSSSWMPRRMVSTSASYGSVSRSRSTGSAPQATPTTLLRERCPSPPRVRFIHVKRELAEEGAHAGDLPRR
jgi:hypothetical protein